jgi:cytidine deaminase
MSLESIPSLNNNLKHTPIHEVIQIDSTDAHDQQIVNHYLPLVDRALILTEAHNTNNKFHVGAVIETSAGIFYATNDADAHAEERGLWSILLESARKRDQVPPQIKTIVLAGKYPTEEASMIYGAEKMPHIFEHTDFPTGTPIPCGDCMRALHKYAQFVGQSPKDMMIVVAVETNQIYVTNLLSLMPTPFPSVASYRLYDEARRVVDQGSREPSLPLMGAPSQIPESEEFKKMFHEDAPDSV